jgi:hypothetical protein
VFEFIQFEFGRLSPKIPEEFEARGFRISFIATTDKSEHSVETYFTVAMRVAQIGKVKMMWQNPCEAAIRLIQGVCKGCAKLIQQENVQWRRERILQGAKAQEYAARESLVNYSPQAIAVIGWPFAAATRHHDSHKARIAVFVGTKTFPRRRKGHKT